MVRPFRRRVVLIALVGGLLGLVAAPASLPPGLDPSAVRLWSGPAVVRSFSPSSSKVYDLAISPCCTFLATASEGQTGAALWDMETTTLVRQFSGHAQDVVSVAFSPDGKLLATGSKDTTVRLWEVDTGREVQVLRGHVQQVPAVCFSSDGRLLASGGHSDDIRLWEVATGGLYARLPGREDPIETRPQVISFSPNSRLLAVASGEGIYVWDVGTRDLVRRVTVGETVRAVEFTPDGEVLASGSRHGLKLWDTESGTELGAILTDDDIHWHSTIAISPQGHLIASGFLLWAEDLRTYLDVVADIATGQVVDILKAGTRTLTRALVFSSDGLTLASASGERVYIWDVGAHALGEDDFLDTLAQAIEDEGLSWSAGVTSVSGLCGRSDIVQVLGAADDPADARPPIWAPRPGAQAQTLPEAFDWRSHDGFDWTTPVKCQGRCGSCVAFANVGVLESVLKIAEDDPLWQPDLSEQALFACGCSQCCRKGWTLYGAARFLKATGIPEEDCWPYPAISKTRTDRSGTPVRDSQGRVIVDICDTACSGYCEDWPDSSWRIVTFRKITDPEGIKRSIIENGPVVANMDVYKDFRYYTEGVYRRPSAGFFGGFNLGGFEGGHAIAIVGYDDNGDERGGCWIVRNSWGEDWGEDGYARIGYGEVRIDDYAYELRCEPSEKNDIIVNLLWLNTADLDLHVTDPGGATICHSQPSSPSGGWLDVDSNADCETATTDPVEEIVWPTGMAPAGTYSVAVDYYKECFFEGETLFRLVITVGGIVIYDEEHSLSPSDAMFESNFQF